MQEDKNKTAAKDDPEARHYNIIRVGSAVQQPNESPSDGNEPANPDENSGGDTEYKPSWPIRLHLGWKEHRTTGASVVTILISLAVLAVIIMQAAIYVKQTHIMAQMVEEGQKTRELENRAYVGVSQVGYQPIPGPGPVEEARIMLRLVNTGRTPATGRAMTLLVLTPEQQLPDSFNVAAVWESERRLPSQEVFMPGADMSLDAGTVPMLNIGQPKPTPDPGYIVKTPLIKYNPNNRPSSDVTRLFVVGIIEYRDFFNVERTTVFCYFTEKPRTNLFVLCGNLNHFN